jgi:hypothetical protein
MPYITHEEREVLHHPGNIPQHPGQLNYVITLLIDRYLRFFGISYQHLNAVIGVLECVKLEFYRRLVAKYEDQKCEENGDVYRSRVE